MILAKFFDLRNTVNAVNDEKLAKNLRNKVRGLLYMRSQLIHKNILYVLT